MSILKRYAAHIFLISAVLSLFAGLFLLFFRFDAYGRLVALLDTNSVRIPILMYHHFGDDGSPGTTISAEMFESHIKALRDDGYTAITFEQLCGYVFDGAPLPQRSIIITIDDGYTSVYDIAYPILKKYDMTATVFIIGVLHGETLYKDTSYPVYPTHFGDAEALEMIMSGVISIQSHSFDMHQDEYYETGPFRLGVMQRSGESEEEYIAAFNADFECAAAQIENISGAQPFVYSYPFGRHSKMSEELLDDNGVKVTLTIVKGSSVVTRGSPESLFGLKRYNAYGNMTADKLLATIK